MSRKLTSWVARGVVVGALAAGAVALGAGVSSAAPAGHPLPHPTVVVPAGHPIPHPGSVNG
jgi:hypothetical protein